MSFYKDNVSVFVKQREKGIPLLATPCLKDKTLQNSCQNQYLDEGSDETLLYDVCAWPSFDEPGLNQ